MGSMNLGPSVPLLPRKKLDYKHLNVNFHDFLKVVQYVDVLSSGLVVLKLIQLNLCKTATLKKTENWV